MNKTALTTAGITSLITMGTALMVLFSMEGVISFADISPVAYANAAIGGMVAGLAGYKARISEAPK